MSNSIAELVSLVHGLGDFALFKAYMDESGIHGDSRICVVAGFVAPASLCSTLEARWRVLLREYRLKFFHAKEFTNNSGEFSRWKEDRKAAFLKSALATIHTVLHWDGLQARRKPLSIAVAIHTDDFKALSVDERRWLTGGLLAQSVSRKWRSSGAPTKPYFLAFHQCVIDVIRFGLKGHSERAHFVFDRQTEFEPSALLLCEAIRGQHRDIEDKMGDVVFASKERAVLLQVADFMAYEAYQHKVRELRQGRPQALSDNAEILFTHWAGDRRRLISIDGKQLIALLKECPMQPGKRFCWPKDGLHPKRIPMGSKVVRFPKY